MAAGWQRLAALLLAVATWGLTALPAVAQVALTQALWLPEDPARPPATPAQLDMAQARPATLPDNWRRVRPDSSGTVWYAVPLDAALARLGEPRPADLALVVPRLADGGALWLNGHLLETAGGTGGSHTRNRTLWLPVPPQLLRPEGNLLHVRVTGSGAARGGLSAVTLGSAGSLRPAYELRRFVQTTVPQMLTFAVTVCFFGAVPLWLRTRRRADLLFALICLSWLPRAVLVLSPQAGPPGPWNLLFALASTLLTTSLIVSFHLETHGRDGPGWRRYARLVWATSAATVLAGLVLAADGRLRPASAALLHLPYFALALVPLGQLALEAWRERSRVQGLLTLTLAVWWGTAVHDAAVALDLLAFDELFWAPVAALLVLLALVWRTQQTLAFRRAEADSEIRRAVAHVADVHGREVQQLKDAFERAREQERQAALAAERTRLLHDLHDGMGSHLITALRMVRREQVPREAVARVIEDSLDDIRLILDSLDLEERDLMPLLGGLRWRMEPRLEALGIALQWQVEVLPELEWLTPQSALTVVRILQEAISNAVRHGAPRRITVGGRARDGVLCIEVEDDGGGFAPAPAGAADAPAGRGLQTMQARARRLGGRLTVDSRPDGGTRVALALPVAGGLPATGPA